MKTEDIVLLSRFPNGEKSDSFQISKFKIFDNKSGPTSPNRHTFYEIVFILKGEGTHYIDEDEFPIQKGALYLILPSQVHHWNQQNELKAYVLRFDKSIFYNQTFLNNITLSQTNCLQLKDKSFKDIKNQFKNILKEF